MAVSLKVPVATLLANAEKQRQARVEKHAAAWAKYDKELPKHHHQVVVALDKAADAAAQGRIPNVRYGYSRGHVVEVKLKGSPPEKPPPNPDTQRIDRDLKVLRATSQTEVTVRAGSDLERYL